ncbi:MAG: hypothetical protein RR477_08785, partial [Raoultibacter sp.]
MLMNMPEKLLGLPVLSGKKPALDSYPLFYPLSYEITKGSIGDASCLFLEAKASIKLPMLLKMAERLQNDFQMPCVVASDSLSKYQIERLVEERIAWINSESTFFLPFLGLSMRNYGQNKN